MKMVEFCNQKDCIKMREKDWNGEFIGKWYCDEHKDEVIENENRGSIEW